MKNFIRFFKGYYKNIVRAELSFFADSLKLC